ncbi:MAG: RnfABCDGE type electron transport complex subunit D, partial [Oscillospiraceae bacterium]
AVSDIDIILGRYIGPMGTTHIIVLIVSAVVLMFRRSISALTFCSGLTTIAVLTYIFPKFGTSPISSVYYECISGMTIFGLIFLACDYFTMPKTRSSRFLYGVIIGVITVVFRHIGTVENPIVFAVLLANPIRISLDRSTISFSKTADELLEKFKTWFANKKYLRDNPPHKPMPIIKPSKALIQQPKFKFSLKFNVDKSKKNGFFKSTHERKNKSDDKPKQ